MDKSYLGEKQFREIQDNTYRDDAKWMPVDRLVLSAVQLFASRYNNPRNSEKPCRRLIKLGTGAGKTPTSLMSAIPFIKMFHSFYAKAKERRYVFIVGFSKSVFIRELLKFPEFNIISYEELFQIKLLDHKISNSSGHPRDRFIQEKRVMIAKIKRRITDEKSGGMIRFIGYKELANKLFTSDIPPEANQTNITQMYLDKKVKINKFILEQFRGSMIIGDEVHQTYNSSELNHYGLALQLILDIYKRDIIAFWLSATIINNNRRELIDNANLIRDPEIPPFRSEDYFSQTRIIADLAPIYEQYQGKVIFLEEFNEDYPEIRYIGEPYPGIDSMKFVTCDMSPLHEQTFALDDLFEQTSKNFMIHDMVLPNPECDPDDILKFHPETYKKLSATEKAKLASIRGLYDIDDAKKKIKDAPIEWKRAIGIDVIEENTISYFTGTFLKRYNLQIYSSKYVRMLDIIQTALKENSHVKFLIFHPYVKGSGIMMVQEILKQNGFIVYGTQYRADTYSSEVFVTSQEWAADHPGKQFNPSTMVTLHYDITDTKKNVLMDEFNNPKNDYGKYIQFFIGAQKIKQSYSFMAVRFLLILHKPTNISEWIQIRGRVYRKRALLGLPPGMRFTNVYTLLSTSSTGESLEARKYKKKMEEFKVIQQIECEINKIAVNNYISYKDGFKNIDPIGAKSYQPDVRLPDKVKDFRYYADDYYVYTLNEICNLIKRAFVSISAWTYDSLYDFCLTSKLVNVEISRELFNIALKRLIFTPDQILVNMKNVVLFDSENYIIDKYYVNGVSYSMPRRVIVESGDYLFLASVDTRGNYQLYPDCFLTKSHKTVYNTFVLDDKKLNISQDYCKKIYKDYNAIKDKHEKSLFPYMFLLHYPKNVHHQVLKKLVESGNKSKLLPRSMLDTYKKLGILGKNWWVDDFQKHTFANDKWDSTPISSTQKNDNNIIVGVIEDEKFKLREPATDKIINVVDRRTLHRGMVCTSTNKDKLLEYINKLGGNKKEKNSTEYLCIQILIRLIDLEGMSQLNDDGQKYIYFL